MTPTNELRFVERYLNLDNEPVRLLRILQQKWIADYETMDESGNRNTQTEWRDVPVEKETK
jgi:hypothetical protein